MARILPIGLLPPQREILLSTSPQRLFLAGVGGGKTHALCVTAMATALSNPSVDGAIFAPTFTLLRRVVLPVWRRVVDPDLYEWKEAAREIRMKNGVTIFCLSTKHLDDVVGLNLGWILMDEAGAEKKGEIVGRLMSRLRAGDHTVKRFLGMFTSPHGHSWLKDWSERQHADGAPVVHVVRSTTYDNKFLPGDFIRNLEIEYPVGSRLHRQELLGEFVAETGLVYGEIFSRDEHTIDWSGNTRSRYVLTVDPGYRASAWLVWQKRPHGPWVVVDEYLPDNELIEDSARRIVREWGRPARVLMDTPSRQNSRLHINDAQALRDIFGKRTQVRVLGGHERSRDWRHKSVIAGLASGQLVISSALATARAGSNERGIVHALESFEWPSESSRDERHDEKSGLKHVIDALEFGASVLTPPKLARVEDRATLLRHAS